MATNLFEDGNVHEHDEESYQKMLEHQKELENSGK